MAKNTLPLFAGSGKFCVYLYRDPRRGKNKIPIYVGKGGVKRKRADIHWANRSHNPLLQNILNKIRNAGLEPIIEIVAWHDIEAAAFKCEINLIAKFGRRNIGTGSLCNLTDGGEGPSGLKRSKEHSEKLLLANTGRLKTEEEKERIRVALIGHPVSAATRAKISAANKGHVTSAEHREKLRLSQKQVMASPEAREVVRRASTGRIVTMETRAKFSKIHKGKIVPESVREKIRAARKLQIVTAEHRDNIRKGLLQSWVRRKKLAAENA